MTYNLRPRFRDGFPSASVAVQDEVGSQAHGEVTASEALEILATVATAKIETQVISESANAYTDHHYYICNSRILHLCALLAFAAATVVGVLWVSLRAIFTFNGTSPTNHLCTVR